MCFLKVDELVSFLSTTFRATATMFVDLDFDSKRNPEAALVPLVFSERFFKILEEMADEEMNVLRQELKDAAEKDYGDRAALREELRKAMAPSDARNQDRPVGISRKR